MNTPKSGGLYLGACSGSLFTAARKLAAALLLVVVADKSMAHAQDLIPLMTSNHSPSGIASASDSWSDEYEAWKAFDNTSENLSQWHTIHGQTGWLAYEFESPKIVTGYSIQPNNYNHVSYAPRDWTFEGWNGTSWTVLDTRRAVGGWAYYQKQTFQFSNATAYKKYQINVTANGGARWLSIAEFEMFGSSLIHSGRYIGLFTNPEHPEHAYSGQILIEMTRTGHFTAKVIFAGKTYPLAGRFNKDGRWSSQLRPGSRSLAASSITLLLDDDGTIAGEVKVGSIQSSTNAKKTRDKNNPTPYEPIFTGSIYHWPGFGGYQACSLTLSTNGAVTLTGWLRDGTPFTTGTWAVPGPFDPKSPWDPGVNDADELPIYGILDGGRGSLRGNAYVYNTLYPGLSRSPRDRQAFLGMMRLTQAAPGSAPVESEFSIHGGIYEITPVTPWMFTSATEPLSELWLSLFENDNAWNYTEKLRIAASNRVEILGPNPNRFQIQTNVKTGYYRGSIINPVTKLPTTFVGFALPWGFSRGLFMDRNTVGMSILAGPWD